MPPTYLSFYSEGSKYALIRLSAHYSVKAGVTGPHHRLSRTPLSDQQWLRPLADGKKSAQKSTAEEWSIQSSSGRKPVWFSPMNLSWVLDSWLQIKSTNRSEAIITRLILEHSVGQPVIFPKSVESSIYASPSEFFLFPWPISGVLVTPMLKLRYQPSITATTNNLVQWLYGF